MSRNPFELLLDQLPFIVDPTLLNVFTTFVRTCLTARELNRPIFFRHTVGALPSRWR
jgi:hypothetical protein